MYRYMCMIYTDNLWFITVSSILVISGFCFLWNHEGKKKYVCLLYPDYFFLPDPKLFHSRHWQILGEKNLGITSQLVTCIIVRIWYLQWKCLITFLYKRNRTVQIKKKINPPYFFLGLHVSLHVQEVAIGG